MTEAILNANRDTWVQSNLANYTFGTGTTLICRMNYQRILIGFDLSSIPSGASISSAKITVTSNGNFTTATYSIYAISDANGDWIEGTDYLQIVNGSPCWNYKEYDTTSWAGSAGLSTSGTDYINTVLGSYTGTMSNATAYDIDLNDDGITLLESIIGGGNNNGFLLKSTKNNETSFFSSEYSQSNYRPKLTINYSSGGNLLKINMNAQMKDMRGGMNG